jgi:hypothetical protein
MIKRSLQVTSIDEGSQTLVPNGQRSMDDLLFALEDFVHPILLNH